MPGRFERCQVAIVRRHAEGRDHHREDGEDEDSVLFVLSVVK